ncbi:LysE/ArgO family amino acid transporter [uncultured Roseovarius sp.]|uniref:LysE/ArgO family amino acid transporter n=1 Tax=uncultured Roseovarius sp. TaxID=293344 RepID=UPI0025EEC0E4|nr:LysE/ArgO family amino acid transporter [uncultured Roseovarius sp.]
MQAVIDGYLLGFSLILAIGAQNAFVLRQGLRREHVLPVVLLCGASDAALVTAGVLGFGALSQAVPGLERVMLFGGVAFLLWYGARNLLAAWRGGEVLEAGEAAGSLRRALLTCLALTWLNPHVYLDTVVLLGSVSAQYDDTLGFGAGAVTASFSFFFMLGYGARLLAPFFRRPSSWRVLDLIVGLTMWGIAAKLLWG